MVKGSLWMELHLKHSSVHYYGILRQLLVCPVRDGYWIGGGYNLVGESRRCYHLDTERSVVTELLPIPGDVMLDHIGAGIDRTDSIVLYRKFDYQVVYRYDRCLDSWYRCPYVYCIPSIDRITNVPSIEIDPWLYHCAMIRKPIPFSVCRIGIDRLAVVYGKSDRLVVVLYDGQNHYPYEYRLPMYGLLLDGLGIWYNWFTNRLLVHVPMNINGRPDVLMMELEVVDG